MRSPVEDHDMVPSLPDNIKSQTHSRVCECYGRPSVQVEPSSVNKMVTASAGVPSDRSKVVQPPHLVSRSGQLQEQGFSVEVAERITAPQKSSTRTIYKSKWVLFEKWCRENSVDFSTPSVKQVSDFFMYLCLDPK